MLSRLVKAAIRSRNVLSLHLARPCSSASNPAFVEERVKSKVSIARYANRHKRKFIDRVRLRASGGRGGDGCVSFVMEGVGTKRPDGGHGGAGGAVTCVAKEGVKSLANTMPQCIASNGKHGLPNNKYGKRGASITLEVPVGTVIKRVIRDERYNPITDEYDTVVDELTTVADLDKNNSSVLLAAGGAPGLGSRVLTGKVTKYGRLKKKMPEGKNFGTAGESFDYEFELKTIADIGLVGFPNAGKSTFLRTVSRAEPEVAPYPFTTLHPTVGIVECPEDSFRMTIADLPGLIDGAHRNVGLGHHFLRHIERTKVLCYVLDAAGTDGRDPCVDFAHLRNELELYAPSITTSRPSLIVANKMDNRDSEVNLERLRSMASDAGISIVPVSALHHTDVGTVLGQLRSLIVTSKDEELQKY